MQFACSMYWGGDIVFAADCDYGSYRELGTICPYCGSAVHLRASSLRNISGKEVLFNAYFAHYKTGVADDSCEARSVSTQGAVDREQIRINAKNQRLELFNDRLWDLIASNRQISSKVIKFEREQIGGERVTRSLKWIRIALKENVKNTNVFLKDQLEKIVKNDAEYKSATVELITIERSSRSGAESYVDERFKYFQQCNQKLHLDVCSEAIAFLATRSGGYCLERMMLAIFNCGATADILTRIESSKEARKEIANFVAALLLGVRWGLALDEHLSKSKKGVDK